MRIAPETIPPLRNILEELIPAGQDPNAWADAELALEAAEFEAKHGTRHAAVRHVLEYYVSLRH